MKTLSPGLSLHVGGAATNLKKEFPTIGEILFKEDDPRRL